MEQEEFQKLFDLQKEVIDLLNNIVKIQEAELKEKDEIIELQKRTIELEKVIPFTKMVIV
jgi:hypothetical protein